MISIRHVHKSYGAFQALRDCSTEVARGAGGTTMPEGAPEDKYKFNENAATTMVSNTSAQKQNEVTNYEISRTSKQIIGSTGDIKRLSAAVIVDGSTGIL